MNIHIMLTLIGPMMAAGIIMAAFSTTGIGVLITQSLVSLSGGNMFALLILTAILCFILGMGLTGIIAYLLLAVLVGPVLIEAGIPPLAAHLFFFWASTWSHVTPPVAITCFIAAPLAGANLWSLSWRATGLSLAMYILPFVFVYNPALIGMGKPLDMALAFIISIIGVTLVAGGTVGYFLREAGWAQRIALLTGGFLLLVLVALWGSA